MNLRYEEIDDGFHHRRPFPWRGDALEGEADGERLIVIPVVGHTGRGAIGVGECAVGGL